MVTFEGYEYDVKRRYLPTTFLTHDKGAGNVVRVHIYPPGKAPKGTCIRPEFTTVVAELDNGRSRSFGVLGAEINSELRIVVRGINARDEVRMAWKVCRK